jgi:hypothetical protein
LSLIASLPLLPIVVNSLGWLLFASGSGGSAQGPMMFIFLLSFPATLLVPFFWLFASLVKLPLWAAWSWFSCVAVVVTLVIGIVAS